MPEQKEITVKAGEKAEFGSITYTIPEDYQYRVYQKTGNNKNFTYDKSVYIGLQQKSGRFRTAPRIRQTRFPLRISGHSPLLKRR